MASGIFSIRNDNLTELDLAPFEAEDLFQELLSKYPSLIAGDQIDGGNPRRWLLVRREMSVPGEENGSGRWSLDHLFLDQDGIPTLVEVKRSTDTRLRREVVGQMLDYAANAVVYWPVETIQSEFQFRCEQDKRPADQELADFLDDETDPETFWAAVKTNLQAGKVRMLFVADEVPRELRRIIEFLNTQMDPAQVLALEIHRYRGDGQETLVSRVIGQTAEAERKKGGSRLPPKKWDEDLFFAAISERKNNRLTESVRAIFEWSKEHGSISWGQGAKVGSLMVALANGGDKILYVNSFGTLSFNPVKLPTLPPFDNPEVLKDMVRRIEAVPYLAKSKQSDWHYTWVSYSLEDVDGQTGLDQLLSVLDSLFLQLKSGKQADPI